MKHPYKATILLLFIFLISQYIGIAVVNQYIDHETSIATGETTFNNLPLGERPEFEEETAYIPILVAVLVGTALLFGIIKLGAIKIWKLWFALALFITLTTSIAAFTRTSVAIIVSLLLVAWRIFKNNPVIHNSTEPLVYAGIAAIFVPVLNLWSVSILLILISVYDAYAVWKSKHMVKLAVAQKKANIFAGLQIPTFNESNKSNKIKSNKIKSNKIKSNKISSDKDKNNLKSNHKKSHKNNKTTKKEKKRKRNSAILGGGDIAFPLLIAGVLLKDHSIAAALVMPIFATIALAILFYFSKKGKFYPAMPFISAGCFIGLGFIWLLGLL